MPGADALGAWQGGRDAYKGGAAGAGSGEGPGTSAAPRHRVKIFNRAAGQEVEVDVPEDRCADSMAACLPCRSAAAALRPLWRGKVEVDLPEDRCAVMLAAWLCGSAAAAHAALRPRGGGEGAWACPESGVPPCLPA